MVDWASQVKGLALPAAYIVVLVGLLVTFSSLYRKRQAANAAALEPWFSPHLSRNIYLSLLHLEQTEPGKEKPVTVPDSILKAALLRRAVEDIHRIVALRSSKAALQTLLQRGSVGDDLWQRFQHAEKELQAEVEDVVSEANALAPNWGQTIFQSANEMAANTRLRERIAEVQATAAEERTWYDKQRAQSAKELLDESSSSEDDSDDDDDSSDEDEDDADDTAATDKKGPAESSSEGEGVLVEGVSSPASTASTANSGPSQQQAGGGKKKRRGKGKK